MGTSRYPSLVGALKVAACAYGGACLASLLMVIGVMSYFGFGEPDRVLSVLEMWRWPVGAVGALFGGWVYVHSGAGKIGGAKR